MKTNTCDFELCTGRQHSRRAWRFLPGWFSFNLFRLGTEFTLIAFSSCESKGKLHSIRISVLLHFPLSIWKYSTFIHQVSSSSKSVPYFLGQFQEAVSGEIMQVLNMN
jgi:hypothetical protein